MSNYKFPISDPDISKAVQERLFQLGYTWEERPKQEARHLKYPALYIFKDITEITQGCTPPGQEYFDNHPSEKVDLSWMERPPKFKVGMKVQNKDRGGRVGKIIAIDNYEEHPVVVRWPTGELSSHGHDGHYLGKPEYSEIEICFT